MAKVKKKKRKANPMAAKAMRIMKQQGVSLKEAWRRARSGAGAPKTTPKSSPKKRRTRTRTRTAKATAKKPAAPRRAPPSLGLPRI